GRQPGRERAGGAFGDRGAGQSPARRPPAVPARHRLRRPGRAAARRPGLRTGRTAPATVGGAAAGEPGTGVPAPPAPGHRAGAVDRVAADAPRHGPGRPGMTEPDELGLPSGVRLVLAAV